MFFHITQTHSHENCSARDPEALKASKKLLQSGDEIGVKVISAYGSAPGHVGYFVVETDSAEKLQQWLDPVLTYFNSEIRPVTDTMALLEQLHEGANAG